jgi:hypothetical protein
MRLICVLPMVTPWDEAVLFTFALWRGCGWERVAAELLHLGQLVDVVRCAHSLRKTAVSNTVRTTISFRVIQEQIRGPVRRQPRKTTGRGRLIVVAETSLPTVLAEDVAAQRHERLLHQRYTCQCINQQRLHGCGRPLSESVALQRVLRKSAPVAKSCERSHATLPANSKMFLDSQIGQMNSEMRESFVFKSDVGNPMPPAMQTVWLAARGESNGVSSRAPSDHVLSWVSEKKPFLS